VPSRGAAYREGVTADDEFRKVAEDLRGLARALRSEIRAARGEARAAARDARRAWRWEGSQWWGPGSWSPPPRWWEDPRWQASRAQGTAAPPTAPPGAPGTGAGQPGTGTEAGQSTDPGAGQPGTGAGQPGAGAGPYAHAAPGTAPGPSYPPGPWGPPWGGRPFPWGPYYHHRHDHGTTVVAAPPKPPRPPAPPVRHKRDGSTLISLLLVLAGLAWLGSASGVVSLSLETVLAAILVVLGAAMVVTARTDWSLSRRHWPVWLGIIVLVLVVASAGTAGGLGRLHFGPTNVSPAASDLGTPISNFAGPIRVNLPTQAPSKNTTLRVHDVFGPISVVVPANPLYEVVVDARTRFGPVSVPGSVGGKGVFTRKSTTLGKSNRMLNLDVSDVFGPVSVTQAQQ